MKPKYTTYDENDKPFQLAVAALSVRKWAETKLDNSSADMRALAADCIRLCDAAEASAISNAEGTNA